MSKTKWQSANAKYNDKKLFIIYGIIHGAIADRWGTTLELQLEGSLSGSPSSFPVSLNARLNLVVLVPLLR